MTGNNDEKALCYVEDQYHFASKAEVPQKIQVAIRNIEAAYRGKTGEWFVTFASATSLNLFRRAIPLVFARRVNALLVAKIKERGKGCCGIVFLESVESGDVSIGGRKELKYAF